TNSITGKRYADDPAIMTWELANEPRPMRPAAREAYLAWISTTAAFIKSRAPRQLVALGHEGYIGTEGMELFEAAHRDPNVDYLTIHIWPKNWEWFRKDSMEAGFQTVAAKTLAYINEHRQVAERLKKPLVVEEFGLPRDGQSFDPSSSTHLRDGYYGLVFGQWLQSALNGGGLAGVNFWAFGGSARPKRGQVYWKPGDDYMGDPPMEEQGLNTVFDSDQSTWQVVTAHTAAAKLKRAKPVKTKAKAQRAN
ncbi:MAG: beta-mannosidase, partial [Sphingobacteriales bacterium]